MACSEKKIDLHKFKIILKFHFDQISYISKIPLLFLLLNNAIFIHPVLKSSNTCTLSLYPLTSI